MAITRRNFLKLSAGSIAWLGTAGVLQSFAADALPSKDKVKLRFAVASDGHYGQANTPFDATHDQMVQWLNAEKSGRGIDFSFINGDLFHDDPKLLDIVKKKWDGLHMPVYFSHGNHDHVTEEVWQKTFGYPWHHSFEKNGVSFITLNTANIAGEYICPDLNWARAQLQAASSAKELFVFMHITPKKWTGGGIECPELVELFTKQKNLKGVFHGHDHDQDGMKKEGGKLYFFDSHIGGNWGTDYRGYRIVEVLKNGEVLFYQMNPVAKKKVNEFKLDKKAAQSVA